MNRLTKPQRALLDEIKETGVLYITRWGPYWRTVEALQRRGLVEVAENDWRMPGFRATATYDGLTTPETPGAAS